MKNHMDRTKYAATRSIWEDRVGKTVWGGPCREDRVGTGVHARPARAQFARATLSVILRALCL